MSDKLTSRSGMLWIQPGGPGTRLYLLDCHILGDLSDVETSVEEQYLMNKNRDGWDVSSETYGKPEKIAFTVEFPSAASRDWLEKVECPFTMYTTEVDCGAVNIWENAVKGQIIQNVRRAKRTLTGLVNPEEDTPTRFTIDLEAEPPLLDFDDLAMVVIANAETEALNDVSVNYDKNCYGNCGDEVNAGDVVLLAPDSAVGPAVANVDYSKDALATVTAAAAQPFGAGLNITGCLLVPFPGAYWAPGVMSYRMIVGQEGTGAAIQGLMAYSDDEGASWVTANIGAAAAGHGPVAGNSLFAVDPYNIFCTSHGGYIYKSEDRGRTWFPVEAGVIHAGHNFGIHFSGSLYGVCGGAAGIVSLSDDGGASWYVAPTLPGAANITACARLSRDIIWAGDGAGMLYYSRDKGQTWTAHPDFDLGVIKSMSWANAYQGFLILNNGGGYIFHTNNGGFNWSYITTPTNNDLNAIIAIDGENAVAVGEVVGGVAMILKISRSLG